MGLFEKRRCQKFLEAVQNFEENNPKTHSGIKLNAPAKEMLAKYMTKMTNQNIDLTGARKLLEYFRLLDAELKDTTQVSN